MSCITEEKKLRRISSDDDDERDNCSELPKCEGVLMHYHSGCERTNSGWLVPEDFQDNDVRDHKGFRDFPIVGVTASNHLQKRQLYPSSFLWDNGTNIGGKPSYEMDIKVKKEQEMRYQMER